MDNEKSIAYLRPGSYQRKYGMSRSKGNPAMDRLVQLKTFGCNIKVFGYVKLLSNFFFNWDSLHARLNSHYKAWSYKKKKQKDQRMQEISLERTYS